MALVILRTLRAILVYIVEHALIRLSVEVRDKHIYFVLVMYSKCPTALPRLSEESTNVTTAEPGGKRELRRLIVY